jgi:hypothetical protein
VNSPAGGLVEVVFTDALQRRFLRSAMSPCPARRLPCGPTGARHAARVGAGRRWLNRDVLAIGAADLAADADQDAPLFAPM